MKFNILNFLSAAFLFLIMSACGNNEINSKAHQESIQHTQQMEESVESLTGQIEDFEEKIEDLSERYNEMEEPDSSLIQKAISFEATLATHKGFLEKYRHLVQLHKEYIDSHESNALSVAEIEAQHIQVKKNFAEFQNEIIGINAALKTLDFEVKAAMK